MGRPAILIDRDGTLCEDVGYLRDIERLRLIPGSAEAILRANRAGFQTVVVTNQSGVARGYFDEAFVHDTHERIRELLAEEGARLDGVYFCPHHPEIGEFPYRTRCACRKPRPGMLLRARDEMGIDLRSSYMIGDSLRDVEAGRAAGAATILVRTGRAECDGAAADRFADDLLDAVDWILARKEHR